MKGGMPESVVLGNESILLQVVGDIIQKDVLQRHNIRKPGEFRSVVNFLIANSSNPVTYRSIKNNFGIKSANTVQKYVEYTEETYLLFSVRRFERKTKKFDKNPRKVYCIDNGIAVKNSPAINERKGALLENLIAIHLKRLGKDFYYYKGSGEADFLIPDDGLVVQACYEINDGNMKRELSGLAEAMEEAKAERGLILTFDQEAKTHAAGVEIMPAWRWLIESERAMNSVRPKS
jgi:predicted AAA+ superfamily ATPase